MSGITYEQTHPMKMWFDGCYGVVHVEKDVFEQLDSRYFTIDSNKKVKHMCANPEESWHLRSLGIGLGGVYLNCNWYKIVLKPESQIQCRD